MGKIVDAAFSAGPVPWLDLWPASVAALGDLAADRASENLGVVHVAHGVIRVSGVFKLFSKHLRAAAGQEGDVSTCGRRGKTSRITGVANLQYVVVIPRTNKIKSNSLFKVKESYR